MAFGTVEFDLSMINQETGLNMTARAYTVQGIENADGSLRELSIGQLVMAICLDRASKLEASIISLMEDMNTTSAQLEAMTEIEETIVNWASSATESDYLRLSKSTRTITKGQYAGVNYFTFLTQEQYGVQLGLGAEVYDVRVNDTTLHDSHEIFYDEFISLLEAKMDEKNSFSQQKMIELQSQTSKRDQAYDMISNILKSLNTVLVGNANNI